MKRIYSLFLVMLLCLVGTTAFAAVKTSRTTYTVKCTLDGASQTMNTTYGYTVKTAYVAPTSSNTSTVGVSTSANATSLRLQAGNYGSSNWTTAPSAPTMTTSTVGDYITARPVATCNVEMTVSGTTITIAYTSISAGSAKVSCTVTGGGVVFNGTTYTNGETITDVNVDECTPAPLAGHAGKIVADESTLTVYYIPTGRFYIKSCNTKDNDVYMSALTNIMALNADARTYWSVWDIEDAGNGCIRIINEGARDIMEPGHLHYKKGADGKSIRNAGYLHYHDTRDVRYEVGDATNDVADEVEVKDIYWLPADVAGVTGGTSSRYVFSASPNRESGNYYLVLDDGLGENKSEAGFTYTGDHVAKGGVFSSANSSNAGSLMWELEAVTPANEAAMFRNSVVGLDGYVGGVVTLDNVSSVAALQNFKETSEGFAASIEAGENTKGGAELMEDLLQLIDPLAEDGSGFYQNLATNQPFFLENMCGYRPSYGGRLIQGSTGSNGTGWKTTEKASVNETTEIGIFYAEDYGTVNGEKAQTLHINVGGTAKYISKEDDDAVTTAVTTVSGNACKFVIDPIIPGVYQIRDVERTGDNTVTDKSNKRYLTITRSGGVYSMCHYEVSEPSTLWKFKTYNTVDVKMNLDPEGEHVAYGTFGYVLDSRMLKADANTKVYGATELRKSGNKLQVVMKALESQTISGRDYYVLQGNKGYLVQRTGTTDADALNVEDPKVDRLEDVTYFEDTNTNLLNTHISEITLQEAEGEYCWKNFFAFTYCATGKVYAGYNGQDVEGFGVGFYRLKPGRKIAAGKAYLTMAQVEAATEVEDITISAKGVSMVFVDDNGDATDVMIINEDGQLTHAKDVYYDLSGREVAKPTKGVFIHNGKKVMFK